MKKIIKNQLVVKKRPQVENENLALAIIVLCKYFMNLKDAPYHKDQVLY